MLIRVKMRIYDDDETEQDWLIDPARIVAIHVRPERRGGQGDASYVIWSAGLLVYIDGLPDGRSPLTVEDPPSIDRLLELER